ncbi:MFS transporter [Escherichia coli]|nr:MFS transporter [Escherichia coli]
MFVFIFVIGVLHQLVTPIQWVMMSDTVDYGEWCNGKRLTGTGFCWHAVCAQASFSAALLSAGCWLMADMMAEKAQNSATISNWLSRYSRLFRRSVIC